MTGRKLEADGVYTCDVIPLLKCWLKSLRLATFFSPASGDTSARWRITLTVEESK